MLLLGEGLILNLAHRKPEDIMLPGGGKSGFSYGGIFAVLSTILGILKEGFKRKFHLLPDMAFVENKFGFLLLFHTNNIDIAYT